MVFRSALGGIGGADMGHTHTRLGYPDTDTDAAPTKSRPLKVDKLGLGIVAEKQ